MIIYPQILNRPKSKIREHLLIRYDARKPLLFYIYIYIYIEEFLNILPSGNLPVFPTLYIIRYHSPFSGGKVATALLC
jgi:hypothetical protein